MNRDAIVATLIGIIIGVCIAAVVLVGPKLGSFVSGLPMPSFSLSLPKLPNFSKSSDTANQPEQNKESARADLIIESPLPDSIISENTVLLSGKTTPNSTVIAQNQTGDWITNSNSDGTYALTITLSEGINTITLTSVADDVEYSKQIVLYQTDTALE